MSRGFISYRHTNPDKALAEFLHKRLLKSGHDVFIDRQMLVGTKWVEETESHIKASDFFVILLSKDSIRSDLVRAEVELAHGLEADPNNNFLILPIRVEFNGELPYDLGAYLNHIQYAEWNSNVPLETIAEQILEAIDQSRALPRKGRSEMETPSTSAMKKLADATESIGAPLPAADPRLVLDTGTVKLTSPFYIRRDSDASLERQIKAGGTTSVIKGPRQMGKSSLLARAHAYARNNNYKSFYIDFQFMDQSQLESLESLTKYLALKIARAFKTKIKPSDVWDDILGPKDNLTDFIEEAVLSEADSPIIILLDEADRVFDFSYRDDFFATIRGWHNRRAIEESWQYLNLVIAHSTEPYLWIQDINQSPFNIGHIIRLNDFNLEEVTQLNLKHNSPIKSQKEIEELLELVGGQPYLVRQAIYMLSINDWSLPQLQQIALDNRGPFGDHLRRFVWRLQQNIELKESLKQILKTGSCENELHFQKLVASGLVIGESRIEAQMRCQLYERYFGKHL